jgi:hypothetical protein
MCQGCCQHLGCHAIHVNAAGNGDSAVIKKAVVDGLKQLASYASIYNIRVICRKPLGLFF